MPSLIDLRRRIRAVKSTQQITKAMKMIAASRLKRAQDRILQLRPYSEKLKEMLSNIMSGIYIHIDKNIHAHQSFFLISINFIPQAFRFLPCG